MLQFESFGRETLHRQSCDLATGSTETIRKATNLYGIAINRPPGLVLNTERWNNWLESVKGDKFMTNVTKGLLTAAASAALIIAPTIAQANASALSLTSGRASTSAEKANKIAPAIIIAVVAGAALIGGVVAIVDDEDEPASP